LIVISFSIGHSISLVSTYFNLILKIKKELGHQVLISWLSINKVTVSRFIKQDPEAT